MTYRILSIDGGGVKGVHALGLIQLIQKEIDSGFLDKIDCFAGTSTGALICVSLAMGISPKRLLFYYKFFGKRIFSKIRNLESSGARYQTEKFKEILERVLPKDIDFDGVKSDLIIPACRLDHPETKRWEIEVYDSFCTPKVPLLDAALASSSAPIYFPSYKGCVDGGIYAVNPSFVALGKAIDPACANRRLDDVKILSIGNGINPLSISNEVNWGVSEWMDGKNEKVNFPLFALMTDLGAEGLDYPLKQLLKERYLRMNSVLSESVDIDDASKIGSLIQAAKGYPKINEKRWENEKAWIRSFLL